jgi:hypothetical protein
MPADRSSPLRNVIARLRSSVRALLSRLTGVFAGPESGRLAPIPNEPLAVLTRNRDYITRYAFRPFPGT